VRINYMICISLLYSLNFNVKKLLRNWIQTAKTFKTETLVEGPKQRPSFIILFPVVKLDYHTAIGLPHLVNGCVEIKYKRLVQFETIF